MSILLCLSMSACVQENSTNSHVQTNANASLEGTRNNSEQNNNAFVERAKPVKVVQHMPFLVSDLSLLLHPLVPVIQSNGKDYSFSKTKHMEALGFSESALFDWHGTARNILFEPLEPFQGQSTVASSKSPSNNFFKATTPKQRLFNHNDFVIRRIYYPHVLTTESVVCSSHDIQQKYCKTVVSGNNETALQQHVASQTDDKKLTSRVKTLQKFGKFLYEVQEVNLTAEERKENKITGNVHEQQALYMSDDTGKAAQKMHADNQYLTHTQWMPSLKRFYFSTKADSNADQKITAEDMQYNYYIDFSKKNPKVVNTTLALKPN